MKPSWCFILVCCLLFSRTARSGEEPSIYSIHIGVNAAPKDSGLPDLRYADDDAMRMYMFFSAFSTESVLAAVLDKDSQKKYPDLASQAVQPRADNLERSVSRIAARIEKDKALGRKAVVYLSYSGHGERTDDGTRMPLLKGFIDRNRLETLIQKLKADVVHLFIDACYGEGVVDSKGIILSETDAKSVKIADREKDSLLRVDLLQKYPEVGALISTSNEQEAYEWSKLGSGVFTHELLSALSGAADVNGDGEIAYSEAAAFISAANRAVEHETARLQVISHPPRINRNLPILSFAWTRTLSFLRCNAGDLGRFYLETDTGFRFVDAHLEPEMSVRLIVPSNKRLWIRSGGRAASFAVEEGRTLAFSSLRFQDDPVAARGGVETAFQQGLFATRFGPSYYTGWIDSRDDVGVSFLKQGPMVSGGPGDGGAVRAATIQIRQASLRAPSVFDVRRFVSTTLFTAAGLSFATGAVFLGFAVHAKKDFDRTTIERTALEAKEDCLRYRGLAIGFGAAAAVFVIAGAVMKHRNRRRLSLTFDGSKIGLTFDMSTIQLLGPERR